MYLDVQPELRVPGIVRVTEWVMQSLTVRIEWLPLEEFLRPVDESWWPLLRGDYSAREELLAELSTYLGRELGDDPEIAALPPRAGLLGFPATELRQSLRGLVRARELKPPTWSRYHHCGSDWDALDLVGAEERSLEVMRYRSVLSILRSPDVDELVSEVAQEAEEAFPRSGLVDEALSRVALREGRLLDALERAHRATGREPLYALAWVQRAVCEAARGRPSNASNSIARARPLRHWDDSEELRRQHGLTP